MAIDAQLLTSPPRKVSRRQGLYFNPWYGSYEFGCVFGGSSILLGIGFALKYLFGRVASIFVVGLIFSGLVCLGVCILLLILGVMRNIRKIRQHSFLVQYGVPVEGRITKVQESWSTTPRVLYYDFTTEKGEIFKGEWGFGTGRFHKLKTGDILTILYSTRKPNLNVPYEAAIFQVEA